MTDDESYEDTAEHSFAITALARSTVLEDYWKRGKGAAKIRWGTPGDFTRCVAHIGKHVNPDYANRICAQWHFDKNGYYPGDKRNK